MQQSGPTLGPFRATRLWNELIQTFRSGMPLKKHRWRMRLYDNCFAASDAVDWLHHHLQSNVNFGPEVTRDQTLKLLQKFVKSGVIQQVKRKDGDKENAFEDDSHLYRFTRTSPVKPIRPSTLSSRTNLRQSHMEQKIIKLDRSPSRLGRQLPECKLVFKTLTQLDIEEAWKTMLLANLQRTLGLSTLDELIGSEKIVAKNIIHNATNINRNGVVLVPNKDDDLPYWVLSAMRCLANWPNKIEEGLPRYPGFERDVFKTVSDYFQGLSEPILTYDFYDLFTNVLVMAERRDRGLPAIEESTTSSCDLTPEQLSLNTLRSFQSVENLMLDLTNAGRGSTLLPPPSFFRKPSDRSVKREGHAVQPLRQHVPKQQSFSITQRVNQYEKVWYASEDNLQAMLKSVEEDVKRQNRIQGRNVMYETSIWTPSNKPRIYVDERDTRKYTHHNRHPAHREELKNRGSKAHAKNEHTPPSNMQSSQRFSSTPDISKPLGNGRLAKSKKFGSLNNISAGDKSDGSGSNLTRSKRFGSATQLFEKFFKNPPKLLRSSSARDPSAHVPKDVDIRMFDVPRGQTTSSTPESRNETASFSSGYSSTTPSSAESCKSLSDSRNRFVAASCADLSSIHGHTPSTRYPGPMRATLSLADLSSGSAVSDNSSVYFTPPSEMPIQRKPSMSRANLAGHTDVVSRANLAGYTDVVSGTDIAKATMKRADSLTSLYSGDSSCAQEALQLCCMMLPAGNRKKLHLLLRMMSKMENNTDLNLHDTVSTRQLILQTFSRCILSCIEEVGLDEILAVRLVTYMMDNYAEILKVPEQLRSDVDNKIAYLRRGKVQIKYSEDDENEWAYCEQVSSEEYEKQKLSASHQAMADLLENIIGDQRMPVKEKKKKLKQFQKAYPDIYAKRLPTTASEAQLFPEKPKLKQPMLSMRKPFSKLRSMRY